MTAAAEKLDAADPLSRFREQFLGADDPSLVAYLDGNSLGRPPKVLLERYQQFLSKDWGGRLIRGWDEGWFEQPLVFGDRLGALTLGAAPGQTVLADSTTVCLYKVIRAAVTAQAGRDEIVVDSGNFPTDRYVVEGISAETGCSIRWIDPDPDIGMTTEDLTPVLSERTAVVVLSHVAYRSGYLADAAGITELAHRHGARVVLDVCHSVGVLPIECDSWGIDYAAGCTYKYLNGGPGAPAFLYVRDEHQASAEQPIQGWMGVRDSFQMGPQFEPAAGIRRFISGTPPILGMLAVTATLDLIEEAGLPAIREKSLALTGFATSLTDELLIPHGARLSSPRDPRTRGGHITVDHPAFPELISKLWARGVIPDFRPPTGIRLGLSPLSTSFTEVEAGIRAIAELLADQRV